MLFFRILLIFSLFYIICQAESVASSISCVNGICTYIREENGQIIESKIYESVNNVNEGFRDLPIGRHSRSLRNRRGTYGPPPGSSYTCAQQAAWGKCGASWMRGYCCYDCGGCGWSK